MTQDEYTYLDLLVDSIKRGYVVFAPKSSKQLRDQYPELKDKKMYPELSALTPNDMLFVFYFRAVLSPFADAEDIDKLDHCIQLAYRSEQVREQKRQEWKGAKGFKAPFPAAFDRMKQFNAAARIMDFHAMMVYRAQCLAAITDKPPAEASPKTRAEYLEMAGDALEGLQKTTKILESGSFGVEESANTVLPSIMGSLADHRTTTN